MLCLHSLLAKNYKIKHKLCFEIGTVAEVKVSFGENKPCEN